MKKSLKNKKKSIVILHFYTNSCTHMRIDVYEGYSTGFLGKTWAQLRYSSGRRVKNEDKGGSEHKWMENVPLSRCVLSNSIALGTCDYYLNCNKK